MKNNRSTGIKLKGKSKLRGIIKPRSKANKPARSQTPRSIPNNRLIELSRTLADPCGRPPSPGFYGTADGYMVRHKKVYSMLGGTGSKHGYFLIDPTFTSQAYASGQSTRSAFFSYGTSDPDYRPPNSDTDPYGSEDTTIQPMVNARTVESPHDSFLYANSNKFRVVSCCMKIDYIGATSTAGGLICTINNLDPDALVNPSVADYVTIGSSVNDLMGRSPNVFRFGVEPIELKWRPNTTSDQHREPFHSVITTGTRGVNKSTPYGMIREVNATGVVTNQQVTTTSGRPALFGVAWTGLPGNNTEIRIEVTINTEYVPKPANGMPAPPRHAEPTSNTWKDAVASLDKYLPGWETVVKTTRAAAQISRVLGGSGINPMMQRLEL